MQNKTIAQQLNIKEFPFVIKDKNGKEIYTEYSDRFWVKREYDCKGNIIYYEDSHGVIRDNRPKAVELTLDEIAAKLNIPVEQLKIKK